jgi:glycosyltransferase domain-containing protein
MNAEAINPAESEERVSNARLNALTITIPTYNRPHHLRRLLAYYQRTKLQTKFLVLDSSDRATVAVNEALVSSCGERFRHVVFPSSLPVAAKLYQGLALIETPYCAFCGDDDLVFPDALAHALDFLQNHADYVCTDGIYLNFFPSNGEIKFQVEYGGHGIEAEHPGARVFRLFQRYESMFYAVFRTHDIRDIFSYVHMIPSLHYQELFQATGALLKGKSHRLPEFYAARQHCDPAEPTRNNWQTFYWFADDSAEFMDHYRKYRGDLWRFYEKFGAEPRMESKAFGDAMDMAHAIFFSAGCPPEYFHSRMQKHWPRDPYIDIKDVDKVLDDLKSESRRYLGICLAWVSSLFENQVANYVLPFAMRRLNQEARALSPDHPWRCGLPDDIAWLASAPGFRKAFLELCRYLEHG